jgi:TonB family protein
MKIFTAVLILGMSTSVFAQEYKPKFAREVVHERPLKAPVCPPPEYPKSSLRNEETGATALEFKLASDGRVTDARVLRSSGFRNLDAASMAALGRCQFMPKSIDGEPVATISYQQFVWTLE